MEQPVAEANPTEAVTVPSEVTSVPVPVPVVEAPVQVQAQPERQLCGKCYSFYGTALTNFMCSKCFKESGGVLPAPSKPVAA